MNEWIKVFAPASIGNIGPGFDTLGMAVNGIGDVIEARIIPEKRILISEIINEFTNSLSYDPNENTAGIAAREVLKKLDAKKGLEFKLHKGIPPGSGLGSSAASAVAAGFAVNLLFGNQLTKLDLIEPITKAEEYVSGAFFVDNTASSLLGGIILTKSRDPLEILNFTEIPDNLRIVLASPNYIVLTKQARAVLPQEVKFNDFIHNMANSCSIIAALYRRDTNLFGRAVDDVIVEKARAHLIPGFHDVKKAALTNGALGASISGAGPTIFAVCDDYEDSNNVGEAMKKAFKKNGLKCTIRISTVNKEGVFQIK
jgi:homoserine kinase